MVGWDRKSPKKDSGDEKKFKVGYEIRGDR